MHEFSLVSSLFNKIDELAKQHQATSVDRVTVRLGALSHISKDHFTEHFVQGAQGTVAEGAQLEVKVSADETADDAQDILLESVELAGVE